MHPAIAELLQPLQGVTLSFKKTAGSCLGIFGQVLRSLVYLLVEERGDGTSIIGCSYHLNRIRDKQKGAGS